MFSFKVSQNWEKHDYQKLRKRKYILFAKDDPWSFKNKKVPRAIFLDSTFYHLREFYQCYLPPLLYFPFCSTFREFAVRPAVMKEDSLSRARIRKSLQRKRNIFILKGVPSRVNSTATTCHVSSFASYDYHDIFRKFARDFTIREGWN